MPSCITIFYLNTEISVEYEFISLNDLKVKVAAQYYHTEFKDLQTSISAKVPYSDLKTSIAVCFPVDTTGPYIVPKTYPIAEEGGIGVYGPIFIVAEDLITGIDVSSLELTVNSVVYTRDDSEITFLPINAPYRYAIRYIPTTPWGLDSTVNVSIFIKDRAGNPGITDLPI